MQVERWSKVVVGVLVLLALTGCISIINSERELQYGPVDNSVSQAARIFAVSSRVRDQNGDPVGSLGSDRSPSLSYFQYDVSVPLRAKPGAVQWARGDVPDPARDFFVRSRSQFSGMQKMMRAAYAARPARSANKRALVFVPGFNSNEAATVYRTAQIDRDFSSPHIKIVYDWPSAGHPQLYLHDADSVTFARDGLARLLNDLARSQVTHVSIMGYSAGVPLVMEALRQLRLTGQNRIYGKLEGVILLSPDIDADVFTSHMRRIGPLKDKLFVFSGSDDAVQKLFAPVWGDKQRLGLMHDFSALSDVDVTFIDPGATGDNGESNHLAVVGSPTYIDVARRMSGSDLVGFAKDVAKGKVVNAEVEVYGRAKRIVLPADCKCR